MAGGRKRKWLGLGFAFMALSLAGAFLWTRWYWTVLMFDLYGFECQPQIVGGQLFVHAVQAPGRDTSYQGRYSELLPETHRTLRFEIAPVALATAQRRIRIPWMCKIVIDANGTYMPTSRRGFPPDVSGVWEVSGTIALWPPIVVAIGLSLAFFRSGFIAKRRSRVGHCPACGYDISDQLNDRPCPECGVKREVRRDPAVAREARCVTHVE